MRRDLRMRNRAVIVLLLPIVTIVWIVGWVLCWKDSNGEPPRMITAAAKDDGEGD
jgi:hypothetical protein